MSIKGLKVSFLLPTVIILGLLGIVTLIPVLRISFFKYIVASMVKPTFIGLDNFREIVCSSDISYYLGITLFLVTVVLAIQIPLGLGIALLFVKKFKGRGLFQTLFTLPLAIAPIAVGCMWVLLLRPETGPFIRILGVLGIDFNYMGSFWEAFSAIVIMNTWRWTPLVTLAILPALVSIPPDILDAARIDGAGFWSTLRRIVLPLIKMNIAIIIFIRAMDTFRIFDSVWILTGGGPGWSTRFVSIDIVRKVIFETDYGLGSAQSLFLLYLTIVFCWIILVVVRRGKLVRG